MRHYLWFLSAVCRAEHLPVTIKEQAMQNIQNTIMSARQPRPASSFASRSKRWTSNNTTRRELNSFQSAQRNYLRYLALARAEAQIGNTVGAENYYQHAEHYFRSTSPDSEMT
jgi:Domain of unknown function (DUF4167)